MPEDPRRSVEKQIVVEAPVDAVWRALTDAQELARWFPREAEVTPGVGGRVWISWGGAWTGDMRISIWEPNARLRLVETRAAFDASGQQQSGASARPVELTLDYVLEGRSGSTLLRLVHSGFGRGADWDDELESTEKGWLYELQSLRHYLERHRGRDRRVVWAQCHPGLGVEEIWRRLWSATGLGRQDDLKGLAPGAPYRIRAVSGDELAGVVTLLLPPRVFAGTVSSLNDALFRVAVERLAGETWAMLWFATYDVAAERVAGLQARMDALLAGLFGQGPRQEVPSRDPGRDTKGGR